MLWTLPLAGLTILGGKKFAGLKNPAWGGPIGAAIGALYAVLLSLLVGPAIQAVGVPFLPLTMTVGTVGGGSTALFREAIPTSRRWWSVVLCLSVILMIWTGFFTARASLSKRQSLGLIVIKLTSEPQPLHWAQDGSSIPLKETEIHATEEATRSVRSGALIPISSFGVGNDARATIILVMLHDVSESVRLPRPDRGLVTYVQQQDGSWQGRDADGKGYGLLLSPIQENGWTRIEIEGPLGTAATEVGVTHR